MAKFTASHPEGELLPNPTASLQGVIVPQAAGTSPAHIEPHLQFNPSYLARSTSGFCGATFTLPDNLSSAEFVTMRRPLCTDAPGSLSQGRN